jgi:DNA repair ATPase RecN
MDTDRLACRVAVENLGGINDLALTLPEGVTLLSGENATNRSSLLRSIAAALGAREAGAQLKTDADSGSVRLTIDDDVYTREYTRSGGTVGLRGDPYTADPELVDTFVALFDNNPARRAVTQGGDLRDLLMQPVNVDEIQRQIEELHERQSELVDEIDHISSREEKLPALTEQRTDLESDLETVTAEISDLEDQLANVDRTGDDGDGVREELESLREELATAERTHEELTEKIEFRRNERESLREERSNLEAEREDLSNQDRIETEIQNLGNDIEELRERRRSIRTAMEDLQTVVGINEELLEDGPTSLQATDGDVVSALDPNSQTVECWTCGTAVERDQLTDRIEDLRGLIADHRKERAELEDRIAELEDEKKAAEREKRSYTRISDELVELDDRIEGHEERLKDLINEREDTTAEIERLEDELNALETKLDEIESESTDDGNGELATLHQELTQLERERGRVENRLTNVVDEIEEIQSLREDREAKEAELEEVRESLEALRGRIQDRERDLVETLNSMMDDLVEVLQYETLSRIWFERLAEDRKSESEFELHIVREGEDGTVYEDTVDTLSESEREVVGLVIALAGYLVHDIASDVPFLLFDSVEMIDADRMAALLEYITSQTEVEFLVVALLSKDTEAIQKSTNVPAHQRIEETEFA